MQPQGTITPNQPPAPEEQLQQPVAAPEPAIVPQQAVTPPVGTWEFSGAEVEQEDINPAQVAPVSWTASEYIAHAKGASWFIALGLGLVILAGITYIITHDFVPVAAIAVAVVS